MLSTSLLLALALTPDADAANVPKIKNVRIRQVVDSNNTFTYRSVVQGSVSDDGTVADVIASIDGVTEAKRRGIEVLITDHHLPADILPDAAVIVNPNQPGCGFPSKHLAGVGVIFYTLLALRAELRERGHFDASNQPRLDALLDLVALGTVADVVRLDANNRVLVAQGLSRIRSGRAHPGIAALFSVAGRDVRKARPFDLGFTAGPRLNAAGRLADMALGIECLKAIGGYDIGQGVVVGDGRIIAVEGPEGTDSMLHRIAAMRRSKRMRLQRDQPVLVKVSKPTQDRRVDLPAIGPKTIISAVRAGISGIAVAAGDVILVEREKLMRAADQAGLFVIGVRTS